MNQDPSTQGRGCRRVITTLSTLMALVFTYRFYTFLSPSPLEIGPETTVIEGPLLPDGRVDYVRALNERMSDGVTPENNAAVPLVRAFGPEIIDAEDRSEYFRLLDIPEPVVQGDYLIGQMAWLRRNGPPIDLELERALLEQFGDASGRPWTSEEFPEVAAWLDANEAPLVLIVAATARPRFYSPLVGGTDVMTSLLPLQQSARSAARLLTARAMLKLGDGDTGGAWDDLLACHRLSRLIGQGETMINDLYAVAISAMACNSSKSLVLDGELTAEQTRRFRADLDSLSPMPDLLSTIDVAERFASLDTIQSMSLGNTDDASDGLPCAQFGFDWALMMRITNEAYDQFAEAARDDSLRARIENLRSLDAKRDASRGVSTIQLIAIFVGGRPVLTRHVSGIYVLMLTTPVTHSAVAEARTETRLRLLRVTLMLATFRADHGEYPESLDDLAPDYFTVVPLDPFVDEPFHYERTASGYRLYGVGNNMTDDGGLTYDSNPQGDDILVETPAAETSAPTDRPENP